MPPESNQATTISRPFQVNVWGLPSVEHSSQPKSIWLAPECGGDSRWDMISG